MKDHGVPRALAAIDAASGEEGGATSAGFAPLILIAVAIVESLGIAAVWGNAGSLWLELTAIHVASLAVVAAGLVADWRHGHDTTIALLGLIAAAVAGPIGALGAGTLGLAANPDRKPSPLIEQWYARISQSTAVDPESRLCEDVGVGRTLDLASAQPQAFPTIMEAGPLGARQNILGLIARHFHPLYLDTLKIALESPDASIRVQAAAVATHIGPSLRRELQECLAEAEAGSSDPVAVLSLRGRLDLLLASGLLDEGERQRGTEVASKLGDSLLASFRAGLLVPPYGRDAADTIELDTALDNLLLSRGCFADLRNLRSAQRIRARHPTARLKGLRTVSRQLEPAE